MFLKRILKTFSIFQILARTKDIDETVRKAAFKFIADKVHIKALKIADREQVLKRGLNDRSEGVRIIVERDLSKSFIGASWIYNAIYFCDVELQEY